MEYLDTKYFSYANPDDPIHRKALIRSIEYVSGQPYLYSIYKEYQKNPNRWENFWDGCVDLLELDDDPPPKTCVLSLATSIV